MQLIIWIYEILSPKQFFVEKSSGLQYTGTKRYLWACLEWRLEQLWHLDCSGILPFIELIDTVAYPWHTLSWFGWSILNPCHAEKIKMPHPLQIFSLSDYLIQFVDINSHKEWQTVQIQISWLLRSQKPTDLDLHCLQRKGISSFSRTRVNISMDQFTKNTFRWMAVSLRVALLVM